MLQQTLFYFVKKSLLPVLVAASFIACGPIPYARVSADADIVEYPLAAGVGPYGMVTGPDGAVWFTEYAGNKIGRIDRSGTVTEYPLSTPDASPRDITIGPDNALWFTQDTANKIGRITLDGTISEFSVATAADSDPGPYGITKGPDNALWFTASRSNKIVRVTTAGAMTEYQLGAVSPSDIVSGPDGSLWFGQIGNNKIGRLSPDLTTYSEYPIATPRSFPIGLTVGPDSSIWFTEHVGNKIGRITTSGEMSEYPTQAGARPINIISGTEDTLWFTELNGNSLSSISLTGQITRYPMPTGGSGPVGMAVGSDGNIWFTQESASKIGVLRLNAPPPPTPPISLAGTVADATTVSLEWDAKPNAEYYTIYRNGTKVTKRLSQTFTDKSAVTGVNNYFVTAATPEGEALASNTISVTMGAQRHLSGTMRINGRPLSDSPYSSTSMQMIDSSNNPRADTVVAGTSDYNVNVTTVPSGTYGIAMKYDASAPQLDAAQLDVPEQFLLKEADTPIQYSGNDHAENLDFTTKQLIVITKDAAGNPGRYDVSVTNLGNSAVQNNAAPTTYTLVGGYVSDSNTTNESGQTNFALFPGAKYQVCVTSPRFCKTVDFNDTQSIEIRPELTTPTQVVASGESPVTISWNAADGATSYNVYRDGQKVGSVPSSPYTDTVVPVGTHSYYITALNDTNESTASNTVNVTISSQNRAPIVGTINGTNLELGKSFTYNGTFADSDSTNWVATIDYGDGTGVQPLTLSALAFVLNHTYTKLGNYTITISVTDNQGATGTTTVTISIIDKTPPTIVGKPDRPPDANGWYNRDVTITWIATDASGVATPIAKTVVSANGASQRIVSEKSCDASGNCATGTYGISIDKTPPKVTAVWMTPPIFGIINKSATVYANATDTLSGVVRGEFYIDRDPGVGKGTGMTMKNGVLSSVINGQRLKLSPGLHKVYVRVFDAAGNASTVQSTLFLYL